MSEDERRRLLAPKVTTKHPWDQDKQHIHIIEAVKMVVFAPIALARLVAITGWFLTSALWMFPLVYKVDPDNLSDNRRRLIHLGWKVTSRVFLFLVGVYRIKMRGEKFVKTVQGRKVIHVANHCSFLDGWLTSSIFPYPVSGVSKKSVLSVPIFGPTLNALEFCWVDHVNKGQGGSAKLAEHTHNPQRPNLILAPEGTTTNGQSILRFRTGAFSLGEPIQPYVLKYPSSFFAPMLTEMHPLLLFYRLLCSVYTSCEVIVLPVHDPTEEEKKDPNLFADNVRNDIATCGNLLLCDITGAELLKKETSSLDKKISWKFIWSF